MPVRVALKVVPGAAQSGVVGWLGDDLKIRVQAPPEKGKANQLLIKLLAETFKIKPQAISIIRGHYSARKVIEIKGLNKSEINKAIHQLD